jgi:uncharacterized protein (TIRG00374 family)
MRRADLTWVSVAVALNIPILLLASARSFLLLQHLGSPLSPRVLFPITILGFVAGGITPVASGEILRAEALRSHSDLSFVDSVAIILYERMLSLYLLAVGAGAGFAASTLPTGWTSLLVVCVAVLAALPCMAARIVSPALRSLEAARGEGTVGRALRYLVGSINTVRFLLVDFRILVPWSLITLSIFGISTLQILMLTKGVGENISFGDSWLAICLTQLAAIVSLLPFGLGIGDGSLAALLQRTGIPLGKSTAVVILGRVAITLPLLCIACLSYIYLVRRNNTSSAPAETVIRAT